MCCELWVSVKCHFSKINCMVKIFNDYVRSCYLSHNQEYIQARSVKFPKGGWLTNRLLSCDMKSECSSFFFAVAYYQGYQISVWKRIRKIMWRKSTETIRFTLQSTKCSMRPQTMCVGAENCRVKVSLDLNIIVVDFSWHTHDTFWRKF